MAIEAGGTVILARRDQLGETRVLVIESEPVVADRIATVIGEHPARGATGLSRTRRAQPVCMVSSLLELHRMDDLDQTDVAICGAALCDGTAIDAMAYLRGMRPDLPVIVAGDYDDDALALEAIEAGALDFILTTPAELRMLPLAIEKCLTHQRLRRQNEHLQAQLSDSLAELAIKNRQLQSMVQRLETMARTDDLTGLANRRWLNLMLERMWAEASRAGRPLAFLMIDLDEFKDVNDREGHLAGDQLLQLVGRVIEANCRGVDVAARYGGDEFGILMPSTEPHEAALVAERIMHGFAEAVSHRGMAEHGMSMSVGLSHNEMSGSVNAEQLVHHADKALYMAKATGKGRIVAHRGEDTVELTGTADGVAEGTWRPRRQEF